MHLPAFCLRLLPLSLVATGAWAQTAPPAPPARPAAEQVIVPQVERRVVKQPRYASNDFAVGLYTGTYATQNYAFRQVLPGGVFVNRTETLSYYAISAGYNVLPGEVFFGRKHARAIQGYVLAGVGSTDFAGQKRQTLHGGFGLRLLANNWLVLQADVRDHVFTLDLLGRRTTTQNIEVTAGLTLFF